MPLLCGSVTCITETILLVLFCLAIPLYVLVVTVLIKYRKTAFKSSFFKIFSSLGVADISFSLSCYLFLKAPHWGWFPHFFMWKPYVIGTWTLVWNWQSHFAQVAGIFLMTINRFTALVRPAKHELIWSERNTNLCIVGQWIFSLILGLPRGWLVVVGFRYQANNETLEYDITSLEWSSVYFNTLTFLHFTLGSFVFCLYARMMYSVYRSRRQVEDMISSDQVRSRKEIRLAVVGLIIAMTLFLLCIYDLAMAENNDMMLVWLFWSVIADMFTECNPFVLFCMCKEVRVHCFKIIGINVAKTGNTTATGARTTKRVRNAKSNAVEHIELKNVQ